MKIVKRFFLFLVPLYLVGCAATGENPVPQPVLDFFAGVDAAQVIGWLIAGVIGVLGVQFSVFQWVKEQFNATDFQAQAIVYVVANIIGFVLLLVTGALNLGMYDLTLANLLEIGGIVYAASQGLYSYLRGVDPTDARIVSLG